MTFLNRLTGAWHALTGKSIPDNMPALRGVMVHSGWDGQFSYGFSAYDWIFPNRSIDHADRVGDMSQNAAVAACLRVLEDNFPQAELRVQGKAKTVGRTRDSESVKVNHPLALLNNRPNPAYDRYTFWGAMVKSAVVDGNAYAIKIRSRAGIPVELWWVPPWMMHPRWNPDGKSWVDWYAYMVNGREFAVDPKDVIHWRYGTPDPRNERVAISKLKSAAVRVISSLNEVDAFTATILINGGVPNVAIEPIKEGIPPPTPDQADRMREGWKQLTQGSRKGEPFIPGGYFKVSPIGFTPEQLALDKIPARLEDQICSLTGVNAMVAQLTSGAQHKTYANMAESRRALYEDTLIPMQARLAECLEHQLLGDPGMGDPETEEIVFSYEGIACLQEDQDARWVRVGNTYKNGVITRATAKGMLGLDFDDDDEVYVDVGTIPADPEEAAEQRQADAQERDQQKPGEGNEALTEEEEDDDESERRPAAKTLRVKALRLMARKRLRRPRVKSIEPCRDDHGRFASCGLGSQRRRTIGKHRRQMRRRRVRGAEHADWIRHFATERRDLARSIRRERKQHRREQRRERRQQRKEARSLIRDMHREYPRSSRRRGSATRLDLAEQIRAERETLRIDQAAERADRRTTHREDAEGHHASERESHAEVLRGIRQEREEQREGKSWRGKAAVSPKGEIPTARDLAERAAKRAGLLDGWREGTLTGREALDVLHALRLECRAILRGWAADLVESLNPDYQAPTKGLGGKARAAVGKFFGKVRGFVKEMFVAGVLTLTGPHVDVQSNKPVNDAVAAQVLKQEQFLEAFEADIIEERKPLDGRVVSRAEQYGAAAWSGTQDALREAGRTVFKWERREHLPPWTPEDPCHVCAAQIGLGWQPVGTLRAIGDSPCLSACHCNYFFATELEGDNTVEWVAGRGPLFEPAFGHTG